VVVSNHSPIVVFDGECALCNGFVAWLIRHDTRGHFLIAGSAGDVGAAVVAAAGLDPHITASTLLVWDGTSHVRSEAIIAVARGLQWPWRAVAGIRLVPRVLRDAVYRYVASRRPRMVADDPSCGVPPADLVAMWRSRLASVADVRAPGA
jgi:predicted DCC family thiol-disulfide oxidoreductase YuxK